jgi:hypothetical protein
MNEAERIWSEKSDEDLLDAAAELEQFTEEGQRIVRAELKRRGLEDPVEQAGAEEVESADPEAIEERAPDLKCLRCGATLRYVDPASERAPQLQWAGRRQPVYDPSGVIHVYACARCGHVELFMDLPEEGGEEEGRDAE